MGSCMNLPNRRRMKWRSNYPFLTCYFIEGRRIVFSLYHPVVSLPTDNVAPLSPPKPMAGHSSSNIAVLSIKIVKIRLISGYRETSAELQIVFERTFSRRDAGRF